MSIVSSLQTPQMCSGHSIILHISHKSKRLYNVLEQLFIMTV